MSVRTYAALWVLRFALTSNILYVRRTSRGTEEFDTVLPISLYNGDSFQRFLFLVPKQRVACLSKGWICLHPARLHVNGRVSADAEDISGS